MLAMPEPTNFSPGSTDPRDPQFREHPRTTRWPPGLVAAVAVAAVVVTAASGFGRASGAVCATVAGGVAPLAATEGGGASVVALAADTFGFSTPAARGDSLERGQSNNASATTTTAPATPAIAKVVVR